MTTNQTINLTPSAEELAAEECNEARQHDAWRSAYRSAVRDHRSGIRSVEMGGYMIGRSGHLAIEFRASLLGYWEGIRDMEASNI